MQQRNLFIARLENVEIRESGAGNVFVTLRGHAAVFNRDSHDLGGFVERIDPGAFSKVLDTNPDVHLVSEHDPSKPLARTANGTLELREDPFGLHVWARVNTATSYGKDEVVKLRDGLVDGMSFAFTVNPSGESWDTRSDGTVERTIHEVSGLYDVSVVSQGAYPAAHAELVSRAYQRALQEGRAAGGPETVAQDDPVGDDAAASSSEGSAAVDLTRYRARVAAARSKSLR